MTALVIALFWLGLVCLYLCECLRVVQRSLRATVATISELQTHIRTLTNGRREQDEDVWELTARLQGGHNQTVH